MIRLHRNNCPKCKERLVSTVKNDWEWEIQCMACGNYSLLYYDYWFEHYYFMKNGNLIRIVVYIWCTFIDEDIISSFVFDPEKHNVDELMVLL